MLFQLSLLCYTLFQIKWHETISILISGLFLWVRNLERISTLPPPTFFFKVGSAPSVEPNVGLELTTEIKTWAEVKSWRLNWQPPGAPMLYISNYVNIIHLVEAVYPYKICCFPLLPFLFNFPLLETIEQFICTYSVFSLWR